MWEKWKKKKKKRKRKIFPFCAVHTKNRSHHIWSSPLSTPWNWYIHTFTNTRLLSRNFLHTQNWEIQWKLFVWFLAPLISFFRALHSRWYEKEIVIFTHNHWCQFKRRCRGRSCLRALKDFSTQRNTSRG